MRTMAAYAGVARAPFLLLPVGLVASGAAAAAWDGAFRAGYTLIALVGMIALHVAVNVLNEVSDMKRGIDLHTRRTPFSGGSGTLPAGALSLEAAHRFGLLAAGLGLGVGLILLARTGWELLPFMVVGALLVLGYTDGLARIGLGEVAAGLGLGGLAVAGTALVQQGGIGPAAVAASIPAFLMTFNLLLLNEFPDQEADRGGGRRNLVLLLGRRGAAGIYAAAALGVPAVIIGAVLAGIFPWPALLAAAPSLLLVAPLRWALGAREQEVPIPALGANVMWNLLTLLALALSLGGAALLR